MSATCVITAQENVGEYTVHVANDSGELPVSAYNRTPETCWFKNRITYYYLQNLCAQSEKIVIDIRHTFT